MWKPTLLFGMALFLFLPPQEHHLQYENKVLQDADAFELDHGLDQPVNETRGDVAPAPARVHAHPDDVAVVPCGAWLRHDAAKNETDDAARAFFVVVLRYQAVLTVQVEPVGDLVFVPTAVKHRPGFGLEL